MATTEISDDDLDIFTVIERVSSVLSLVGCIFIIATFCSLKSFHKPINRLVFYASMYVDSFLCSLRSSTHMSPLIFLALRMLNWSFSDFALLFLTVTDDLLSMQREYDDQCGDFDGQNLCGNAHFCGMPVASILDSNVSTCPPVQWKCHSF